ncbi:helix-turn-helix domain-containing protein [Microbacterium enclense]|uniref:Uncharacterized protein n=1 Tax=Microbacterium enclense TaxID=993073 RepID=A0A1G6NTH2_9MICO|nr:helix-turn-helix domain-containing protein [Microbacterium enclense]KSU52873.1 hypothetical protein AS029_12755 [Microbacterium enclense]SDC70556.1 hypothetical protein SAMN05216418_2830 [Microbacterium enclense]
MTVSVNFADQAWARLAVLADGIGITVPELLEDAAQRLLVGTSRFAKDQPRRAEQLARTRAVHKQMLTSQIIRLRAQGRTVMQIADAVGYSSSYVSKILCENGARTHKTHTERTAA